MSNDTQKPYIKLGNQPGILSLFMFDHGVAKNLSNMAQDIMRREPNPTGKKPSSLTPGERELIAAYVSKGNECEFCYRSHEACALEMNDPAVVKQVIHRNDFSNVSPKMVALLEVAERVRKLDRTELPNAIAFAKDVGATDQDIHDAVFISAFFNMCNRYVDGLGTTFEPGQEVEGGKGLAKYGYLMTIRRFIGQVLPTLFSSKKPPVAAGIPR